MTGNTAEPAATRDGFWFSSNAKKSAAVEAFTGSRGGCQGPKDTVSTVEQGEISMDGRWITILASKMMTYPVTAKAPERDARISPAHHIDQEDVADNL